MSAAQVFQGSGACRFSPSKNEGDGQPYFFNFCRKYGFARPTSRISSTFPGQIEAETTVRSAKATAVSSRNRLSNLKTTMIYRHTVKRTTIKEAGSSLDL